MTGPCRPVPPARTPRHETHGHPDRLILPEWTGRGGSTPIRTTTPATTLGKGRSPLARDPHLQSAGDAPMTSDSRQLSAAMTATLTADLEGRVPVDLVADIVRAVLDESRQVAQNRGVEPSMFEARRRLERFIRARSSR